MNRVLGTIIRPNVKNPCFVYRIINDNGTHYVGQTKDFKRRMNEHENLARRYGAQIMEKHILDVCDSKDVFKIENEWINYFRQFPGNTNG